ncbi:MAG: outer membrane lipoprotein carrier protein LolA [Phycisphaerae bacterium]|nr:outer membrane lipoprotein carrier protein LolA [Phycisphaerae bacterium]
MKSHILWSALFLIGIAVNTSAQESAPPAKAPELSTIEKEITAAWKKVDSFRAKVTLDVNLQASTGMSQHLSEGTVVYRKSDGKDQYRQELISKHFSAVDGGMVTETFTTVADGRYLYNMTEKDGLYRGTKREQKNSGIELGGQALFDYLDDNYLLNAQPEGELDGRPVWIITGTSIASRLKRHITFYISKEWGLLLKREVESARPGADLPDSLLTLSDIEMNVKPDKSLFEFNPPPGVDIKDKTTS